MERGDRARFLAALAMAVFAAACGDNLARPDATPIDIDSGPIVIDAGGPDATPVVCGDGEVTGDELCDTAISAGNTGACPTAGDCPTPGTCENVALLGEGTCFAECSVTDITELIDDDGCCPPTGNSFIDNDCAPVCGNDLIEAGEDCDDGGTDPGDGCDGSCQCEAGVCGDGDVNCDEQCDDGGTDPGDGCDGSCQLEAVAFRVTSLNVREPHMFALVADVLCTDITDMPLDQCGVNCQLNESIQMDSDGDGLYDLSVVTVFRPLRQDVAMTSADILVADCTLAGDCNPAFGSTPDTRDMFNTPAGGPACLEPDPAHLHTPPYDPPVVSSPASCVVSEAKPLSLTIAGIVIPFDHAEIAGMYNADPATQIQSGLIKAFVSETAADATILPDTLDFVGGKPLSEVIVGGTNNCKCDHGTTPAGCQSDLDVGPDGTTSGWWFYMNFDAEVAGWDETPSPPPDGGV